MMNGKMKWSQARVGGGAVVKVPLSFSVVVGITGDPTRVVGTAPSISLNRLSSPRHTQTPLAICIM